MLRRAFLVAAATLAGTAIAGPAMAADKHTTTVFVAGDSTAATWPADVKPKAGWGQALPAFLDQRRVRVRNLALSGASSKSFVEAGLLDQILGEIRPGDYLIISFGHNDEKTDDRGTDPATTFPAYLTRYVEAARAHHAHPVLVTPVERRRFDATGHAYRSHGAYPQAMIDLGARLHVPVVDLSTSSLGLWDTLGAEGTKADFLWLAAGESPNWPDGVEDNTHFRAHGAIDVARLVAEGLKAQHVLPPHLVTNLQRPVPENALSWPETVWQPPV
jgi:lysophospholipase L1-like esterase